MNLVVQPSSQHLCADAAATATAAASNAKSRCDVGVVFDVPYVANGHRKQLLDLYFPVSESAQIACPRCSPHRQLIPNALLSVGFDDLRSWGCMRRCLSRHLSSCQQCKGPAAIAPPTTASTSSPFPVVLVVHGGGWKRFSRRGICGMHGNVGRSLASRGFVVAVMSYRTSILRLREALFIDFALSIICGVVVAAALQSIASTPSGAGAIAAAFLAPLCVGVIARLLWAQGAEGSITRALASFWPPPCGQSPRSHPDHTHDVARALAWCVTHIDSYRGDPYNIALLGHSAGAHMVAMLLVDPSLAPGAGVPVEVLRRVTSAVLLSGPYSAALMDFQAADPASSPPSAALTRADEEALQRRRQRPLSCVPLRRCVMRAWFLYPAFGYDEGAWDHAFPVAHCRDPAAVRRLCLPPLLLVNASSDAGLGAHTDLLQSQLRAANAAGRAWRRPGTGIGTLQVRAHVLVERGGAGLPVPRWAMEDGRGADSSPAAASAPPPSTPFRPPAALNPTPPSQQRLLLHPAVSSPCAPSLATPLSLSPAVAQTQAVVGGGAVVYPALGGAAGDPDDSDVIVERITVEPANHVGYVLGMGHKGWAGEEIVVPAIVRFLRAHMASRAPNPESMAEAEQDTRGASDDERTSDVPIPEAVDKEEQGCHNGLTPPEQGACPSAEGTALPPHVDSPGMQASLPPVRPPALRTSRSAAGGPPSTQTPPQPGVARASRSSSQAAEAHAAAAAAAAPINAALTNAHSHQPTLAGLDLGQVLAVLAIEEEARRTMPQSAAGTAAPGLG